MGKRLDDLALEDLFVVFATLGSGFLDDVGTAVAVTTRLHADDVAVGVKAHLGESWVRWKREGEKYFKTIEVPLRGVLCDAAKPKATVDLTAHAVASTVDAIVTSAGFPPVVTSVVIAILLKLSLEAFCRTPSG